MASNTVRVTLLADAKGFQKGMRQAEDATTGFEKKASTFTRAVQGFFALQAVQAVGAFVADSVRAFSELEQATGAVETVFGEAGDSIEAFSKRSADAVGLSQSDFKSLAAQVGGQLQAMGFSADEAAAKTEELIQKGADMAATYGGSVSDAVNAISSLLRGERDPIERYAVSVKEADVQARSLALGLDTSTAEAKKQADAMAALDLLTEQTAKTQGQFAREADTVAGKMERLNAQMEDAKANVGQGFGNALLAVAPLLDNAAKTIGILGIGFADLTGAITPAQAAIMEFETHMGLAADTAEAALTIWKTSGESFTDLLPALELNTTELGRLRDADEDLLESLGMTSEEVAEFKDLVGGELVRSTEDARTHGLVPMTGAMADLEGKTDDATSAMRDQFDLIDGRLDVFANYTGAVDDQAAAQAAVNEAIDKYGENSPEHIEAVEDLAAAYRDVKDAEIAVVDAGGMTRAEFIRQQTGMGLLFEDAQRLADKYDALFTPRTVTHTIRTYETREATGRQGGRQHGGPVAAGMPVRVGEAGPETFVPTARGRIIPAHRLNGHGTGPAPINITINAGIGSDPNAIGRAVVEALQRYERANGSIPVRTLGR